MSFILDALKKSENERQRRTGPSLADVRAGAPDRERPRWLIPAIALLAINVLVVVGVLMWPEQQTPTPQTAVTFPETKAQPSPSAPQPRPAAPAAAAKVDPAPPPAPAAPRPAVRPLAAESSAQASPAESLPPAAPVLAAAPPVTTPATPGFVVEDELPTLNELTVGGKINLPSLHIDIHVYSTSPQDRFVFVNNKKYREGDRLSEGPRVEEISTVGVILNSQGQRFLLPRD